MSNRLPQQLTQQMLRLPLFEKLPARQISLLLGIAHPRNLAARTSLWRRGQGPRALWVLLQGRVLRHAEDRSQATATAVCTLGEEELLGRMLYGDDAMAGSEVFLLEFPSEPLYRLFASHADMAHRICRNAVAILSRRLQRANDRVIEAACERADLDARLREVEGNLNAAETLRIMRG